MPQLPISIDRDSDVPLSRQLYEEMRRLILSGRWEPGERIPSTRLMAEELDISRPTIAETVAQLIAEGFMETRHGSGTFVREDLRDKPTRARRELSAPIPKGGFPLSDYARALRDVPEAPPQMAFEISFFCWSPALDLFPSVHWGRIAGRHARCAEPNALDRPSDSQGFVGLRTQIADTVRRYRDVQCDAEQVLIVNGLNQGIDIFARLHVSSGSPAIVEEPGYPLARSIFRAYGAKIVAAKVDEDGIDAANFPRTQSIEAIAYVTPALQFPTGVVMSAARRLALLEWAAESKAVILEDDYDSIYQSAQSKRIPALMSLDRTRRVVYLGTLNQEMFPSLGLAYLIVPRDLVEMYRRAHRLSADQIPLQTQMAVTDFIAEGHMDRHIRKLGAVYNERREALIVALKEFVGVRRITITREHGGVFLLCKIRSEKSADEICERLANHGVGLMSTDGFYSRSPGGNEFIFGFGALSVEQIREGVRRLAKIL